MSNSKVLITATADRLRNVETLIQRLHVTQGSGADRKKALETVQKLQDALIMWLAVEDYTV